MPAWLQPTSWPTLIGLGLLTAAALAWLLVRVPLHRPAGKARALGQQAVASIVSIALSVALLASILNASNAWYTTWGSLVGRTGQAQTQTVGGPASDQPTAAEPAAAHGWQTGQVTELQRDPRSNPAFAGQEWTPGTPSGQYLTVTIPGQASAMTQQAAVWLPPSYLSHPERRYPVIVAFAGIPGSVESWTTQGLQIGDTLTGLVGKQQIRESIVVVPDVFPGNFDTECVDSADGSTKMETFVATDVVDWIKTNLRAAEGPKAWATIGLSGGGWCSSMITMRHPETFAASINMSGYFTPSFSDAPLRPADDKTYDLVTLASTNPPPVHLWYWGAKDDAEPHASLQAFSSAVRAPTMLTSNLLETGGHSIPVWQSGSVAGLRWLGGQFAEFAWVAS